MKEHKTFSIPAILMFYETFGRIRGLRVWGARTLSSDSDWKYINVGGCLFHRKSSRFGGTSMVVFEPNDEPSGNGVKRVISSFLTQVWRDGALMGRTADQAFFVKCDRTTMTQNDIDNGRLIVQVGIAPVKPAELLFSASVNGWVDCLLKKVKRFRAILGQFWKDTTSLTGQAS
jgi:phage tail sheath protein FI